MLFRFAKLLKKRNFLITKFFYKFFLFVIDKSKKKECVPALFSLPVLRHHPFLLD